MSPYLCLIVSQILNASCYLHIKYNFMCIIFVIICFGSSDYVFINVNGGESKDRNKIALSLLCQGTKLLANQH